MPGRTVAWSIDGLCSRSAPASRASRASSAWSQSSAIRRGAHGRRSSRSSATGAPSAASAAASSPAYRPIPRSASAGSLEDAHVERDLHRRALPRSRAAVSAAARAVANCAASSRAASAIVEAWPSTCSSAAASCLRLSRLHHRTAAARRDVLGHPARVGHHRGRAGGERLSGDSPERLDERRHAEHVEPRHQPPRVVDGPGHDDALAERGRFVAHTRLVSALRFELRAADDHDARLRHSRDERAGRGEQVEHALARLDPSHEADHRAAVRPWRTRRRLDRLDRHRQRAQAVLRRAGGCRCARHRVGGACHERDAPPEAPKTPLERTMIEEVVQVQQRRGRAERGHDPLRHDAVQPYDVGLRLARQAAGPAATRARHVPARRAAAIRSSARARACRARARRPRPRPRRGPRARARRPRPPVRGRAAAARAPRRRARPLGRRRVLVAP